MTTTTTTTTTPHPTNPPSTPPSLPLSSTSTPTPSRFLTDVLRPPHAPNASYLLTLSQASLNELYNTQIKINQIHAEARKKFVIARAWFDGVSNEVGDEGGDGGEGEVGKGKVGEAKRVYERALGELEMRRLEVLRVERDVAALKGDVAFLTKLVMRKRRQQQQQH